MEILFIVDSIEDIERKISLLDEFGAQIKFFVEAKYVSKILTNKEIINRLETICNNNVNETVDNYIKSDKYTPQPTLLYHSSAKLSKELIDKIRLNQNFAPNVIYVKKKLGLWTRFKLWFYQKLVKLVFGLEDEYASTKLQYFNTELMAIFKDTNFKNHVFKIPNSVTIELDEQSSNSYYPKSKFNKNTLYNPIALCLILICYVVLEKFLVLPFWCYFLVVALLLATIINWIIMLIKDDFDIRYKK